MLKLVAMADSVTLETVLQKLSGCETDIESAQIAPVKQRKVSQILTPLEPGCRTQPRRNRQ